MKDHASHRRFFSVTRIFISAAVFVLAGTVNAETVTASQYSFTATVESVEADTGTGIFTGTGVGDSFSGTFNYGLTAGDIGETIIFPSGDEALHVFFRYPSSISSAGPSVDGEPTTIGTINDLVFDQETADFVNSLAGTSLSAGDEIDGWSAESESPGTIYQNDEFYDGVIWLLTLGMAPDFTDNLDFIAQPPALNSAIFAILEVQEYREGLEVYTAYSTITSDGFGTGEVELAPVPVPAAAWLFGSALGLLGWARRRAA